MIIPETSNQTYIGGKAALNLHFDDCPDAGDWHAIGTFFRNGNFKHLYGEGQKFNSNSLLGDYGIRECSAKLGKMGVSFKGDKAYAANYIRAIADMVLMLSKTKSPINALMVEDYLTSSDSISSVIQVLSDVTRKLDKQQQEKVEAG